MANQKKYKYLVWLRMAIQVTTLAGFLGLVFTGASDIAAALGPLNWVVALAAGAFGAWFVAGVTIVALSLLIGRWFCGWVCPLGTLQQATAWLGARLGRTRPRPVGNGLHSKWFVLGVLLPGAFAGIAWLGALEPLNIFVRFVAASDSLRSATAEAPFLASPGWAFDAGLLVGIVALSLAWPRFWCRHVCPAGALLSIAALGNRVAVGRDSERCNRCQKCAPVCQHQCIDGTRWLRHECNFCMNCLSVCPENALTLGVSIRGDGANVRALATPTARRGFLAALGTGVALPVLYRPRHADGRGFDESLLRPPGARAEADFQERCLRCGACMEACPSKVLRPALLEAGPAALLTPKMDFSVAYCRLECDACARACPTGAIERFRMDARMPSPKTAPRLRTGLASVDKNRCLPWAAGSPCLMCHEFCPTSPKAISAVEVPGKMVEGPEVRPTHCVGCGACQFVCPLPRAAILVSSANESRHPDNRVTL